MRKYVGNAGPAPQSRILHGISCILLLFVVTMSGCGLGRSRIVSSPLSYSQLEKEVLTMIPLGTPREEVVARLSKSGIKGTFGSSDSIYYCDLWKRETGERWHLDLALLFDEQGKLYDTRPAQSDVAVIQDDQTPKVVSQSNAQAALAVAQSATKSSPVEEPNRSRNNRTGLRTPFVDEADLR